VEQEMFFLPKHLSSPWFPVGFVLLQELNYVVNNGFNSLLSMGKYRSLLTEVFI
jgi:hypothetical protein